MGIGFKIIFNTNISHRNQIENHAENEYIYIYTY